MRVIHVITRLIVGGAQENTIDSVLGLRRKPGLTVELMAGPTAGSEGTLEPLVAQEPGLFTLVPSLVRPVRPWHDARAFLSLRRLFRERRPEIVHTHSGKAGILGRFAARAAGVPIIIHTIHGPSFGPWQGVVANAVFRSAERRAAGATTHFVVVAHTMTRQYLDAGIGSPAQYTRILSGFRLEGFLQAENDPALRARLGLAADDVVIGKIARLFKLKGHDDLFKVAPGLVRRFPKVKFLLVGDGPWRERFENLARRAGVEKHFVFTGLVPPYEVPRYVGIMDLLVHLSRREGLPRALPQALAAGKPVVAYDCDGASEVCHDGQTGFLIRPGDLVTLEGRLSQLAAEPGARARLGETGRAYVRELFSVQHMVDALDELYVDLSRRHLPGAAPAESL